MSGIAEIFRTGGPTIYIMLALFILGGGVVLLSSVLSATKRRVPWAVWMLCPALIMVARSYGSYDGIASALDALQLATPETQMKLMARGIFASLSAHTVGMLFAGVLSISGALGLGVGSAMGTGKPRTWTLLAAGLSLGLSLVLGTGLLGLAIWLRTIGPLGLTIGLGALAAGVGCALANLAWHPEDEADAARTASARLGAAFMAIFGLLCLGSFVEGMGLKEAFAAVEMASPGSRNVMLEMGAQYAAQGWYVGLAGAGAALLFGLLPALLTFKQAMDRRSIFGLGATLVMIMVLGGASLGLGMLKSQRMEQVRQPENAWALRASIHSPALEELGLPDDISVWDVKLTRALDSCVLHRTQGAWQLSSATAPGSVWDEHACKASAPPGKDSAGCPGERGVLKGPICSGFDGILTLAASEESAHAFASRKWGDGARYFVFPLDAHMQTTPSKLKLKDLRLLNLFSLRGLLLVVHPVSTPRTAFAGSFLTHSASQGWVATSGEQRERFESAQQLGAYYRALPDGAARPVVTPGKDWDMSKLALACALTQQVPQEAPMDADREASCHIWAGAP